MAISEFLVLALLVAGLVILGTLIIIAAKNEKKKKLINRITAVCLSLEFVFSR